MSLFEKVEHSPADPIFGLAARYKKDKNPNKVDLGVGVYRGSDLKNHTMRCVSEAEKVLMKLEENKGYLPIGGHDSFIKVAQDLAFGEAFCKEARGRLFGAQSIGGTGALRLGGELLKREVTERVYVSDPTWPNHIGVFEGCGMKVERYPYYNKETHMIDHERMLNFFAQIPERSVVVLHTCCHNPTGCDLNPSQWRDLSTLFLKRKLIPFFDFAYQGFGRGIEEDAWALRHFAEKGHELFLAASYSKSFGLYGERVGSLSILSKNEQVSQNVGSVIRRLARVNYSNPPRHGSGIVTIILQDSGLREMWIGEVNAMRRRAMEMRSELFDALTAQFGRERFSFLKMRLGLFSMLGLEREQVERMREEYGIYCTDSSRVNLTGLSEENLPYVIEAIVKTSR
ncbi:MAG: Aspartate aminotransferase [Chlamydiae bacterium]|nr:Aspartate aminotransferase [Chlamydiota bacterium]